VIKGEDIAGDPIQPAPGVASAGNTKKVTRVCRDCVLQCRHLFSVKTVENIVNMKSKTSRAWIAGVAAVAASALGVTACGGPPTTGTEAASGGDEVSIVAYSTPQAAIEAVIPEFNATPEGKGVTFKQSFAASGEQSRAVEAGLPADLVYLSLEPDVTRLVDAGIVDSDWSKDDWKGKISNSVVVFMTRAGNPKSIDSWDDLVTGDVDVIAPNPISSGGARWNTMAAYGAQLEQGKTEEEGIEYLRQLFENISVQDKSARDSLQTFQAGQGDVLIGYENEAIAAQQAGEELEYVIPDQTILIENPAAVANSGGNVEAGQAFLDYLKSEQGQEILSDHGYRPVDPKLVDEETFPAPATLFTIEDVGGWAEVTEKFFGETDGIVTKINEELGVPSE
jgi:sulfate/thiosulfate transport system substrate-binding protein